MASSHGPTEDAVPFGFLVVCSYKETYAPGNYACDPYWQATNEMYSFTERGPAERKREEVLSEFAREYEEYKKKWPNATPPEQRVDVVPLYPNGRVELDEPK